MFHRFSGSDRKIVYGVKFDGDTFKNLKGACDLAKHTGMTLRLVHVIEKWQEHLPGCYTPGSYFSSKFSAINEDNCIKDANAKFEELKTMIDPAIKVEQNVLFGSVAEGLLCDAVSSQAALIVCSYRPMSDQFLPKGLSTALSLLSDAGVPVLAIPQGFKMDYEKKPFKIIACDSLLDDCSEAISTACELGMDIGNTSIIHLHIHQKTPAEIAEWGEHIQSMMESYKLEVPSEFEIDNMMEQTRKKISHQLDQRIGMLKSIIPLKQGCEYAQQIRFGDLFEQFGAMTAKENPDIIAFGKHKRFHRKTLAVGSMPSYTMLGLGRPVLAVAAR